MRSASASTNASMRRSAVTALVTNSASTATAMAAPIVNTTPLLLPAIELTIRPAIPSTKTTTQTRVIQRAAMFVRSPRQWLVLDAVRLLGTDAQFLATPRLVLREVAFEPTNLAVTLEPEHVGRDAIEEPAVVADDHRAA